FYSISNCQEGLRGVSFGNFLIKQVVEDLRRDLPKLDTFVTLSPVVGFATWLDRERADPESEVVTASDRAAFAAFDQTDWAETSASRDAVRQPLLEAAAWYFMRARDGRGRPIDPVARFHLGNGARLERLNFLANTAPGAMHEAYGLMVNYLYKLD